MNSKLQVVPSRITHTNTTIANATNVATTTAASYGTADSPFVMIGGQFHPVQGQPSQHTYTMTHDPLEDIMDWYGRPNNVGFHFSMSSVRDSIVWDLREFYDWFDLNCAGPVFAQRQAPDYWKLFFTQETDQMKFSDWWLEPRGVKIEIDFPNEETRDYWHLRDKFMNTVRGWCRESISGNHKVENNGQHVIIEFESEAEAVMMKLAWNDGDPRETEDVE